MRSCLVTVLSASLLSSSVAQQISDDASCCQLRRGFLPAEGVGARAFARADGLAGALLGGRADGVALGDLDGDGDVDAVLARAAGPDALLLGDGEGGFAEVPSALARGSTPSRAVALGDLDLDGALDVIVAVGPDAPNRVFVTAGGDVLRRLGGDSALVTDRESSFGVAVGDLDADGRPDVVVANRGQPNVIYANLAADGGAAFRRLDDGVLHHDVGDPSAVIIDDADDDGDTDILITNRYEDDFVYMARGEAEFDFIKITVTNPLTDDGAGDDDDGDLLDPRGDAGATWRGLASGAWAVVSAGGRVGGPRLRPGSVGAALELTGAPAGAAVRLVIGVPAEGAGGATPATWFISGRADGEGRLGFAGARDILASGVPIAVQAVVEDASRAGGLAASEILLWRPASE